MNKAQLLEIVWQDLHSSDLGDMLDLSSKATLQPLPGPSGEIAFVDNDNGQALLAWQLIAKHVGTIRGAAPTGREVRLEGATYVYVGPGDKLIAAPFVQRFIDWADVFAQVGVFLGRQVTLDNQ